MKEYLIFIFCKLIPPLWRKRVKSFLCTKDRGQGNTVKVCSNFYGKVRIFGDNNNVVIGDTEHFLKLRVLIAGNNNTVHVGEDVAIRGASLSIGTKHSTADNVEFSIGEGSSFVDKNYFYLYENDCSLSIGKNCMFSNFITVRCGEKPHALIDRETGKIITGKYNVSIGDHCWIGTNCYIMKNAGLASNTVVGSNSVVTKKFKKDYCVVAGNPAKIVRENVGWVKDSSSYKEPSGLAEG